MTAFADIDTTAVLVDLDVAEANIRRFQDYAGKAATLDGDDRSFEEIAAGRMAAVA